MSFLIDLQQFIEKQVTSQDIIAAKQRGLVPRSGDWQKPDRWVKPKEHTLEVPNEKISESELEHLSSLNFWFVEKILNIEHPSVDKIDGWVVKILDELRERPERIEYYYVRGKYKGEFIKKPFPGWKIGSIHIGDDRNVYYFTKFPEFQILGKLPTHDASRSEKLISLDRGASFNKPSRYEINRRKTLLGSKLQISSNILKNEVLLSNLQKGLQKIYKTIPADHIHKISEAIEISDKKTLNFKFDEEAVHGRYIDGKIILSKTVIENGANKIYEVLSHEIGHAVHKHNIDKKSGGRPLSMELREKNEKNYRIAKQGKKGFPSQYSKTNYKEFFAECYSTYIQDPENLKQRNLPMYKLMEEVFAEMNGQDTIFLKYGIAR